MHQASAKAIAIGAYKGQEALHAFGRGQQTRSVLYLQQSSLAWEGDS